MEKKHTPGPWAANGNLIEGSDGETIAYVTAYNTLTPKQKANARLIAAAPELLDALKALLQHTQHADHFCGSDKCAVVNARAAIANATGGAQ